ncbi:MAG: hypothetical protein Q4C81_08940 [Kocuria sp.]|nr:hypothetical protein [Kocuria sp.]
MGEYVAVMGEYAAVLLPSIGVGLIFWFVLRSVVRADRGEREAQKTAQEDAERWYHAVKAREEHRVTTRNDEQNESSLKDEE